MTGGAGFSEASSTCENEELSAALMSHSTSDFGRLRFSCGFDATSVGRNAETTESDAVWLTTSASCEEQGPWSQAGSCSPLYVGWLAWRLVSLRLFCAHAG